MHILLVHQSYVAFDEPGGTRHHELACFLAQLGHQVTVIASPVSYLTGASRRARIPWVEEEADPAQGIRILRTYTYPALHRSFAHRVLSFFSFMLSSFLVGSGIRKVDVIWGTSPPIFQAATAWALARIKRVPFLFEVRDLWPAFAIGMGILRTPILIQASEWLERFLYRHADCVMVNSPGFVDHVKSHGARRIELLPNGADPRMFKPQDRGIAFRREHGLQGRFIALYAGAHGLSNDLSVLLEAARYLCEQPEITFVFLGDGKEKAAMVSQASQMGLTNVTFLPPIPKSAMAGALAAADACIAILKPIPLYATVYPNKVFDYMAAGRPVILAIAGVIQEVIENAGAGIAVRPGDALALSKAVRKLAEDRPLGLEMGKRGRMYVESHFDRARIAQKLSALFNSLLQD